MGIAKEMHVVEGEHEVADEVAGKLLGKAEVRRHQVAKYFTLLHVFEGYVFLGPAVEESVRRMTLVEELFPTINNLNDVSMSAELRQGFNFSQPHSLLSLIFGYVCLKFNCYFLSCCTINC